ncbi:MAG: hypothetical protein OHK0038_15170 [Flammeovirgaceae bacterium]
MSVYMLNSSNELITEDYYEQDLDFEKKIEAKKFAFQIGDKINFQIDSLKQFAILSITDSMLVEGKINFLKPDDKSKDFSLDIKLDSKYQQLIPIRVLSKGRWKISIIGKKQNQKFEKELNIYL